MTSIMSGRRRPSRLAMILVVAIAFWLALGTGSFFSAGDAGATPRLGTAAPLRFPGGTPSAALTASESTARTQATVTPEVAYDLAEANGKVESLGGAAYYGSAFGNYLVAPIVALVSTPDLKGYWLIGADGSVYPFGDARNEGGTGGEVRADPVVAAAATPDGAGYWLVTSSGQVMTFGDAESYGSITTPIRAHVVGIEATTDGQGYWIACSTGGVFHFGDAVSHGSAKAGTPGLGIVAMAATPDGGGYWLADADGTLFMLHYRRLAPRQRLLGLASLRSPSLARCQQAGRLAGLRSQRLKMKSSLPRLRGASSRNFAKLPGCCSRRGGVTLRRRPEPRQRLPPQVQLR